MTDRMSCIAAIVAATITLRPSMLNLGKKFDVSEMADAIKRHM